MSSTKIVHGIFFINIDFNIILPSVPEMFQPTSSNNNYKTLTPKSKAGSKFLAALAKAYSYKPNDQAHIP